MLGMAQDRSSIHCIKKASASSTVSVPEAFDRLLKGKVTDEFPMLQFVLTQLKQPRLTDPDGLAAFVPRFAILL
jgi:hypothetical protein